VNLHRAMKRSFFFLVLALAAFPHCAPAAVVVPWRNITGVPDASTSAAGIVELATNAEASDVQNASASLAPSVASMQSAIALRAPVPRQGLVFDGTTYATLNNVSGIGTGDYTVVIWSDVASVASQKSVLIGTGINLGFRVGGSIFCTSASADFNDAQVTTGPCMWVLSRASGTTTPYINAVAKTPVADPGSITNITQVSAAPYAWRSLGFLIYNRALSAAEILALYESGAPAAADYGYPGVPATSSTSLLTGDDSTFATAGNWSPNPPATVSGGKLNLVGTHASNGAVTLRTGRKYRLSITVDSNTGTLQFFDGATYQTLTTGSGAIIAELACVVDTVLFLKCTGGTAVVDNALLYPLGLLCAPEPNAPGNGLVWNDQSGNGAHIALPTSGVAWALPDDRNNIVRGTTATNGNQQLLGATTLPGNTQILRIRAKASTGTPAITLGTSSGGSDIVSSVTLSTSWKDLTIALTGGLISGNSSVWVGSNTTATISTNLLLSPVSSP
jgi:hypothetical protein